MQRMWRRGPDGEVVRSAPEPSRPKPPTEAQAGHAEENAVPAPRKRAQLGVALRLGFRDTYDHLGMVVLISLLWGTAAAAAAVGGLQTGRALFGSLPGTLPLLLSTMTALAGLVLVGGPLCGGVFRYARNGAARQEPEVFDLAWGFRSALGRCLALAAVQAAATTILLANCYFYLSQRQPVLTVLGALFGYVALYWGLMSLYQWPLLAEQEIGLRAVLRKSALLVVDNLGFSLGVGVVAAVLTVVLWLTMVGGLLLWAGALGFLCTQATRELLRKYDVLPPDPTLDPIAGETHELGGYGWHE